MAKKHGMTHKEAKDTLDMANMLLKMASLTYDEECDFYVKLSDKLNEAVDIAKLAIDLMDEKIAIEKREGGKND